MKHFLLKTWLILVCLLFGVGTMWADTTGTIKFGTNDVKINAGSVTGDDDLGNSWTITTAGTTSFTTNAAYYQVGSSSKPATSITFTTTLPESSTIKSMSAKFGGFSGTAGTVNLKVGNTTIGNGSLNATSDVTVNSTSSATGTVLTVTLTGIAKGVKVYNISYTIEGEESIQPVDASWSVEPTSMSVKAGMTASATITTNYDGTLTVSSNAEATATASIDGKVITVTGIAAGVTTLQVIGDATSSYNALNKTIDVTVIANDRPANEIFYESFDTNEGSGGNDNKWSGSIASSDIKQDNEGWTYEKGSGANECAKFGTGSALGTATTPALGQACNATLTFKAAAWNGNSENTTLKLSVIGGGTVSPATVTLTKGAWNTFTATLTGLTADSKVKFEGNSASNSRFFLDEVSIVKTGEATPVKSLSSIAVKTEPTKVTYTEGEKFDPAGLVITAHYSDESTEDVAYADHASDFTFTPSLSTNLATTNGSVTITYGGKTTTQTITVNAAASIANTQETAYTVAEAIALIDAGKGLSTPVYVKGIVSKIVTAFDSKYGNISFDVSADGTDTGDQFRFYRNFKGADNENWTSATEAPEVGDEVIGYGTLTKYNSTYEFAEGNYIVSLVKSTPSKTKPELSFADLSCEATLGQTFTAPALTNPEGVKVTYSSSAEGVATVDNTGAVTLVSAGNTTITASFDGTDSDTYESNSASYTLVVKEATTPEPGDVTPGTYDIAINNALWGTEENGAFNGTIPETLTGTQNGVTITFNKGEGANLYINNTETRIYADEELVVSVPEGYSITRIVNTSSSSKSATITTTPPGYDSETKTWTGNAQFVTFTVSGANGFQTLTVTFVQGGVAPEPTPDFGTINFVANNNDGYWATFSSTKDVIFDADDVVVYTVAVDDNAVVMIDANNNSLSCVTDKTKDGGWVNGYYVQAGAGVLINSVDERVNYYFIDNDPYTSNILNEIETDTEYNMLRAASVEMTGDYKFYKLAYNNYTNKTGLGFYWGKDGGAPFAAKEGGAYLAVPSATASNMRGFNFDSEDTLTAIEGISNNGVACEIYNLQGQRIQRIQQGVNIVNGRKVIR